MTIRASANPTVLVAIDDEQALAIAMACRTVIALHTSPPTVEQIEALRPPEKYIDTLRSTLDAMIAAIETRKGES
jgi:hypothetical protein